MAQLRALTVLSTISCDADICVHMYEHGLLPVFLELLRTSLPAVQQHALKCLVNMTVTDEVKRAMPNVSGM